MTLDLVKGRPNFHHNYFILKANKPHHTGLTRKNFFSEIHDRVENFEQNDRASEVEKMKVKIASLKIFLDDDARSCRRCRRNGSLERRVGVRVPEELPLDFCRHSGKKIAELITGHTLDHPIST